MSASQYERELKNILEGEKKTIFNVTKTCSTIEKDNYLKISNKPFAVIRAAGSFGIDLVATRGDISFLTEVKTTIDDKLHFSSMGGKPQQQAELIIKVCEKTKNLPIYAFRTKGKRGDSWRIFTLESSFCASFRKISRARLRKPPLR